MTDKIVNIDFEARSVVELKKSGLRRYAQDASTKALCMAWWAYDISDPLIWLLGQPFPERLIRYLNDPEVVFLAWNAQFEIEIWEKVCVARYGFPPAPESKWHDTMGDSAYCSFPLALGKAAEALGLPNDKKKDAAGKRLITKLCMPKKDGTFVEYHDDPDAFNSLYNYCKQDTRAERAVFEALPYHIMGDGVVEKREDKIQRLTWLCNSRGAPVDVESVQNVNKRIAEHIETIDHAVQKLTDGRLDSPRQGAALLRELEMNREAAQAYMAARELRTLAGLKNPRYKTGDIPGITLDNLRGEETDKVLKDWDITEYDRKLLMYQQDINHASVAKFKKILIQLCSDGTVKDNLQYCGAGTGRDTARGFQLQNLPRDTEKDPEMLLEWFRNYTAKDLDILFSVLGKASTLIRPMICAPAGKKLIVTDYSKVEAVGSAWTAREENILEDFRNKIDPYKKQASVMYGIPYEDIHKGSQEYQYGKLSVLACGYQGSHSALTKFAEGYGLIIERKEAVPVVKKFREARPLLVAAWPAFGDAAVLAVQNPGMQYQAENCQHAVFQMYGEHLTMELPSGRKLWYPYAKIQTVTVKYEDGETGEARTFKTQAVTCMWMSSFNNKWERRGMSGGNFFQNYVQAICRDLLMEAVIRLEAAGYEIVLRVHDEVGALAEDTKRYSLEEMDRIMCIVPDWAHGFPINSSGYESRRYKK